MAELEKFDRYGEIIGKEFKIEIDGGDAKWTFSPKLKRVGDEIVIEDSVDEVLSKHATLGNALKENAVLKAKVRKLEHELEVEKNICKALTEVVEKGYLPLPEGVTPVDGMSGVKIEWNGSFECFPVLTQDSDIIILPKGTTVCWGEIKGINPDWSKAPKGFNWWAADGDGKCHWYRHKPVIMGEFLKQQWYLATGDYAEGAKLDYVIRDMSGYQWNETLTKRPGWRE